MFFNEQFFSFSICSPKSTWAGLMWFCTDTCVFPVHTHCAALSLALWVFAQWVLLLVLMATWLFILQETWANATSNKSPVLLHDSNGDAVGLDVLRPVSVCSGWPNVNKMLASSGSHRAEVTVRCEKCVYWLLTGLIHSLPSLYSN